jgi:hypothetical protein
MKKLNSMFDAKQFAAEFFAARDGSDVARRESRNERGVVIVAKGGASAAKRPVDAVRLRPKNV